MPDTTHLSEAKRALLEQRLRGNPSQIQKATNVISPRSQDGPVSLSFNQQQFWLLSQLNPHTSANNVGLTINLPGPLDVGALEQSLTEIVRRHEAWRTSFPVVDGAPVQLIHSAATLPLPEADLQELPAAERENEASRLGRELLEHPFDLAEAPPLRALLVRLSEEEYRLFLVVHHIICDGVSFYHVVLTEFHALYHAFSTSQPSPLPELPIQYADYALWQRETLQGEVLENHLSYWKNHLAGASSELALPTDRPRSSAPALQKEVYLFSLPAQLSQALNALSRREGATLFMTLLAAFGALLYRYCGQEDIVIGAPSSGRTRPEVRGLLGAFVNTLPVRLDLSGNPTFRDVLKRTREAVLGRLAHEDLPFEQLVRYLQPERVAGKNPIFQVLFNLQPPLSMLPSGWRVSQTTSRIRPDNIDLTLDLEERPEGLSGTFNYSADLFEATSIERLFGHWQTLLEGIVTTPDQPIASLPLLTQAERQQLLVEWNTTPGPYPDDLCFHHLIESQALRTPDAVAVVCGDQRLTYRQLDKRANQLAHYLRTLGVGPEVLVGLCLDRSAETVVGVLGILKAGGAYVPLDPTSPSERLAFMLADSGTSVLLTQQRLLESLPAYQAQIVCLDRDEPIITRQPQTAPMSGVTPDNLAYVIYTSGSTGTPKGVLISHRGVPNLAQALHTIYSTGTTSRVLAVASFSFDASVADMLMALPVGGTLYLATEEERVPGPALLHLLREQAISIAVLMPSMLAVLPAEELPALQVVIAAGEACSADLVAKWAKGRRFLNVYGPTEATVATTWAECVDGNQTPPIGCPLPNTQVYALDASMQPVPIGVVGELYIGGVGLARGYHHRPELAAERFIPHLFSQEPGERLYRTGDLVRWRIDGMLDYVGRIDQQVKLRGFRVELGEIENTLVRHPAVREAVVVSREDIPGDKRLVGYVVPTEKETLTRATLRGHLKKYLPEYMIPANFVFLDVLPLTTSGKVDRRVLPAPEEPGSQPEADFVAPRTQTEMELAAIWMDLFGLKRVGIHANFFDLGGHSLLAVRVLTRIYEHFQVQLPLSSLFEAPTIAELALKIVQSQAEKVDEAITAQLLAELEQISDSEVEEILAHERQEHDRAR